MVIDVASIPFDTSDVTVLRFCRCQDCEAFWLDAYAMEWCRADHMLWGIVWGTGEVTYTLKPSQWHYCGDYRGPTVVDDLMVIPKGKAQAATLFDPKPEPPTMDRVIERVRSSKAKGKTEGSLFDAPATKQAQPVKVY